MAAAARKPDPLAQRRVLAEELVGIHHKHAKDLARADELKSELKAIATAAGTSFQEVIVGKGKVSVAGAKAKRLLGQLPEIVPEKFNALPKKEQAELIKAGIVAILENYTGAYYGQVTVDLFPGAAK